MLRTLLLLAVFAPNLDAQFNRLVTGSDGSRVVFSSSLSLSSEPTHNWPKLFEATTSGVRLLEERFPLPPPLPAPLLQSFHQIWFRDESSDSSVQALNVFRPCSAGGGCVFVETRVAHLRAPGVAEPQARGGFLRLSSDGRYAFNYGSTVYLRRDGILDLWTNAVTPVKTSESDVAPPGRRVIANSGLAVSVNFYGDGSVRLVSRDGVVTVAKTSLPASSAIIENEGRYIVYETATPPHRLVLYDIAGEWELPLVWAEEGCTQPALSDDGLQLLFLSAANWAAENDSLQVQAWSFDLVTGGLRQLTHDTAGISEATLSGDGRVVWAVTLAGRLLHIDVSSRTRTEIVGRTVDLSSSEEPCRQSLSCVLKGRGLAHRSVTATEPLPFALDGIEVKVDGIPVPLVSVAPTEIRFVLPWALQAGQHRWEVIPGNSIFQQKNVLLTSQVN